MMIAFEDLMRRARKNQDALASETGLCSLNFNKTERSHIRKINPAHLQRILKQQEETDDGGIARIFDSLLGKGPAPPPQRCMVNSDFTLDKEGNSSQRKVFTPEEVMMQRQLMEEKRQRVKEKMKLCAMEGRKKRSVRGPRVKKLKGDEKNDENKEVDDARSSKQSSNDQSFCMSYHESFLMQKGDADKVRSPSYFRKKTFEDRERRRKKRRVDKNRSLEESDDDDYDYESSYKGSDEFGLIQNADVNALKVRSPSSSRENKRVDKPSSLKQSSDDQSSSWSYDESDLIRKSNEETRAIGYHSSSSEKKLEGEEKSRKREGIDEAKSTKQSSDDQSTIEDYDELALIQKADAEVIKVRTPSPYRKKKLEGRKIRKKKKRVDKNRSLEISSEDQSLSEGSDEFELIQNTAVNELNVNSPSPSRNKTLVDRKRRKRKKKKRKKKKKEKKRRVDMIRSQSLSSDDQSPSPCRDYDEFALIKETINTFNLPTSKLTEEEHQRTGIEPSKDELEKHHKVIETNSEVGDI